MKKLRVLIACEYSGIIRRAFQSLGHDAWSCDLLPSTMSGHHIQGDVTGVLNDGWDLMIAHPPCTYLTIAGARYYNDPGRAEKRNEGIEFFRLLQNAPIKRIAIENPIPFKTVMSEVGRYHQRIQPYEFGDPHKKTICLWLKGLPPLMATDYIEVKPTGSCVRKSGPRAGKTYNYYYHQGKSGHKRSQSFPGIAKAMADQWGEWARPRDIDLAKEISGYGAQA